MIAFQRLSFMVLPWVSALATNTFAADLNVRTPFDSAPWISARAAGLSQCLSSSANGLDAYYYNPAMIGGLRAKQDTPLLTHLFFPYIGNSESKDSGDLMSNTLSGEKLSSDGMADQLRPTSNGARPYSAVSLTPVFVFNRLMAGYTYNHRTASVLTNPGGGADALHLESRTMSGPILGFSAVAPKDEFYLGVSVAYLKSHETIADFDETNFASEALRKPLLDAGTNSYEGLPINLGFLYRFNTSWHPAVSIVVNDVGSTRYSPSNKTQAIEVEKERGTVGFGVSPMIKGIGMLHLNLEGTNLTQHELPTRDKIRASSEFTFGDRFGADSVFSVRLGYAAAGVSYGAGINLGIISAQIASFAEDIGAGADRVVERRSVINLGINIADY